MCDKEDNLIGLRLKDRQTEVVELRNICRQLMVQIEPSSDAEQ